MQGVSQRGGGGVRPGGAGIRQPGVSTPGGRAGALLPSWGFNLRRDRPSRAPSPHLGLKPQAPQYPPLQGGPRMPRAGAPKLSPTRVVVTPMPPIPRSRELRPALFLFLAALISIRSPARLARRLRSRLRRRSTSRGRPARSRSTASLGDPGWNGATQVETFYETNPGDNVEPKVKTVAWLTYDDRFFYAAFDFSDPDPKEHPRPLRRSRRGAELHGLRRHHPRHPQRRQDGVHVPGQSAQHPVRRHQQRRQRRGQLARLLLGLGGADHRRPAGRWRSASPSPPCATTRPTRRPGASCSTATARATSATRCSTSSCRAARAASSATSRSSPA